MQACLNFKCLYSNNNDFNICTTTIYSCLWRQSYNMIYLESDQAF